MMYPRLLIDLGKLRHNGEALCRLAAERGVADLAFVTKVFCADGEIARTLAETPCRYLADSRIENLEKLAGLGKDRILLRLPMPSQAEAVVRSAEISFNSEPATLRALSAAAEKAGKIHRVVLMIDLGDLREGIFFENREAIFAAAEQVEADPWLELLGAAFNLTCYGSVLPSVENLSVFLGLVREMEERIGRRLSFVSGGNSSSLPLLLSGEMPEGVTNLRLGEAVALGRETAYGQALEGLFQDAVCLEAELVEVQTKPSYPVGEIGVNAFGERGSYVDLGPRRRAIAAIGRQDMECGGLRPMIPGVTIVGASSDHLILDITQSSQALAVGDVVPFALDYGGLLRGFTSPYVQRAYRR